MSPSPSYPPTPNNIYVWQNIKRCLFVSCKNTTVLKSYNTSVRPCSCDELHTHLCKCHHSNTPSCIPTGGCITKYIYLKEIWIAHSGILHFWSIVSCNLPTWSQITSIQCKKKQQYLPWDTLDIQLSSCHQAMQILPENQSRTMGSAHGTIQKLFAVAFCTLDIFRPHREVPGCNWGYGDSIKDHSQNPGASLNSNSQRA